MAVERTKAGPFVEALNDPRLWIQIGVILFAMVGGWFSLKAEVSKASDQVVALDRRVTTVEGTLSKLPERLATLESESRNTTRAVERIERWVEPAPSR